MQLAPRERAAGAIGLTVALGFVPVLRAQPEAAGSGSVSGHTGVYADSDSTHVVTTIVQGNVALPAGVALGADLLVDVISSASVDVVSAASPAVDVVSGASPGFREVRWQWSGRAGIFVTPEVDLWLGFTHSTESDWDSYAPAAGVGADLARRNTRLVASFAFGHNDIGKAGEPRFAALLRTYGADVGLTQLVDRRTLLGASYAMQLAYGLQASPYRRGDIGGTHQAAAEAHPDLRRRHGFTAHGLRYLGAGVALDGRYRFYLDDWGVSASLLAATLRLELGDHWDLRALGRGYFQSGAYFWRERYALPADYVSADRELCTFWDAGGGLRLEWHRAGWTVGGKLDGYYYRFLDYARLDHRVVLLAGIGGSLTW
ncbi:MAG: DUF3570 domain-containing protein [Deltaproteobacteria bacterium]|nr:DUF3570 domain-containing protein [Deltaproteobacteria bacterium]